MRKNLIIVGVIGLLIVVFLLVTLFKGDKSDIKSDVEGVDTGVARGVVGEPLDVALDFYGVWSEARSSTTTDPYAQNLVNAPALSVAVSEKLARAESSFKETGMDPVLCQTNVPEKLRAKSVYENETAAQVLLFPKDNEAGTQSLVSLTFQNDLWVISDIVCGNSEQAPEQGEFNFEEEGFLLKQSIKPPLDNKYWHLVFTQNGVLGHTAPLFLSADSVCVVDGKEEGCADGAVLKEAMKVMVRGNVTEAGVEVKRVEEVK